MRDWKEYLLTEVGTLKRGKSKHRPRYAFHLYGGKYPFVQTGDIKAASKYVKTYTQTYSEAGLQQSLLWDKGTLCITIAANIADIAILDFDACFPDSVLGFKSDGVLSNQQFIYYLLIYAKKELLTYAEGSVQDNINLGTFEKIKFMMPPLPEQQAIAEVLSSLDDKIDLLNRQNKTLEDLAQTYFRQWFIEGEHEEFISVSDIAKLDNEGVNPSIKPLELFFHYSIPAFDNEQQPIQELGKSILSNKFKVRTGTILVSKLNPSTPRIWIIGSHILGNSVCSTEFQVLNPNDNKYQLFLYFLMKSYNVVLYFSMCTTGTSGSHQRIKPEYILQVEIGKPDDEKLLEYNAIFGDVMLKVQKNMNQIQTLQKLRDTLLPKLISGEVQVKGV